MPPQPGVAGGSSQRLASWARPSSWPLRTKIVATMLALFTVITVAVGAASVVSLGRYLERQTDDALRTSLARFTGAVDGAPVPPTRADDRRGPGDEGLVVRVDDDEAYANRLITTDQLAVLESAGLGRDPRTLDLGGSLGLYRVLAGSRSTSTYIVGLPLARQFETVGNAVQTALFAGFVGLVAMGALGTWLVRRDLAPLRRVAATATRVAQLPLAEGKVALIERVPEADTDRRTEVGQVGAALNELLDHVDASLNARHRSEQRVRRFVADASHELRTPLASIRGYAELTQRETEPVPPSVSHALERVEAEAKRMSSLVEDLLLLARLDAGRPLQSADVDLSEMVVNAVSDAHAASPSHQWVLDLPEEPVVVRGDQARLHQIVANLLANARVHTGPGTTVRTGLAVADGRVRISVHDDGPGVAPELQANVFERFSRGDESRNRAHGSTGLGLSIVAAVAEAHGGSVELHSRPGDTTFVVVLPASADRSSTPEWAGRVTP